MMMFDHFQSIWNRHLQHQSVRNELQPAAENLTCSRKTKGLDLASHAVQQIHAEHTALGDNYVSQCLHPFLIGLAICCVQNQPLVQRKRVEMVPRRLQKWRQGLQVHILDKRTDNKFQSKLVPSFQFLRTCHGWQPFRIAKKKVLCRPASQQACWLGASFNDIWMRAGLVAHSSTVWWKPNAGPNHVYCIPAEWPTESTWSGKWSRNHLNDVKEQVTHVAVQDAPHVLQEEHFPWPATITCQANY